MSRKRKIVLNVKIFYSLSRLFASYHGNLITNLIEIVISLKWHGTRLSKLASMESHGL